jgi:hypothetical protein
MYINFSQLYKNKEYEKIIDHLNPERINTVEIPPYAKFQYIWSLFHYYISSKDFYKKINKKEFNFVKCEIVRLAADDLKLATIIREKEKSMEFSPEAIMKRRAAYAISSDSIEQNDFNYNSIYRSVTSFYDNNDEFTSFPEYGHDYDNETALEQENIDFIDDTDE